MKDYTGKKGGSSVRRMQMMVEQVQKLRALRLTMTTKPKASNKKYKVEGRFLQADVTNGLVA